MNDYKEYLETGILGSYRPENAVVKKYDSGAALTLFRDTVCTHEGDARVRERDEQGRLRGTEYIIREQPISEKPTLENPILEKPTLDKPTQAKPTLENPTQLKKIYNKNKSSMYEEIPQSNQSKEGTETELTEILQNCELKSFESKTAQMLESAVRVLYYKQSIKLSGAVLPQTEIRNLLRRVNRDTLIDAVEVLRHNENEVQNPQGYLYSVILNAVNAEHTSTLLELPDNMIDREMLYASD